MKNLLRICLLLFALAVPVSALEFTAPTVPDSARSFMPSSQENFGQALLEVLRDGIQAFSPQLREASGVCLSITAVAILVSVVNSIPGTVGKAAELAGTVSIAALLFQASHSMIHLATDTVTEISEYGKLLLPVMTAALAAQGSVTTSTALYTGTALFNSILSTLLTKLLMPVIYLYLALTVAGSGTGEETLLKFRDTVKSLMVWVLKIVIYVFTGYIGITGVVSGTTDAATLKAAKLTISGAVPVVGNILSDASEAVLVSASLVKNSTGLYGFFAILALWIRPFLKIAAHYLLLKATGSLCDVFGCKRISGLIQDFSGALGLLLAMTGTVCLMLLISLVCFMKGAN